MPTIQFTAANAVASDIVAALDAAYPTEMAAYRAEVPGATGADLIKMATTRLWFVPLVRRMKVDQAYNTARVAAEASVASAAQSAADAVAANTVIT